MYYILFLFITITAIALLIGLVSMAKGNKLNKNLATKLMSLRVIFQGLALATLLVIYFLSGK
jgi:hypothetical protein